jgi:Domain of unknown function (DUF4386)
MRNSIKKTARIGGLLYLINIILGFFAIGYVPGVIVVSGDAAATTNNIVVHEQLYRFGLVTHIIILLTNIPLAVVFYRLFKVVDRTSTLIVVFFTLVGTSIEAVNLLNQFAPLTFLNGDIKGFSADQLNSLTYGLSRLQSTGVNLALIFFGCYGITVGYLIFKSGFLPRIIGIMMAVGGCCYIFNSFANFIEPEFASNLFPYILVPSGLSELSFCLWLLIVGVNAKKWEARFSGSAQ